MSHQVDLNESGHRVVPVRPGPYRDLGFQQRSGLGMGPSPQHQFCPLGSQFPVDRRRAHPHQQYRLRVRQVQFPVPAQQGHEHRQHGRQSLAGRGPQHHPADHQRHDHPWTIHWWPRRTGPHWAQFQSLPQSTPRIVPVPARQLHKIIKDPHLLRPAPAGIRPGLDHRDGLALAHRQSHPSRMSAPRRFPDLFQ
jgi:hypothetical protein